MSKERNSDSPEEIRGNDIRIAAMNLLARREHSRSELFAKLTRRYPDGEKVDRELDQLVTDGLQSDERFVKSFISGRLSRMQGPLKIHQELKRFNVEESLVSSAFSACDVDWQSLALEAVQRKFGGKNLGSRKEKDRARQFLYRRGFPSEICVGAVDELAKETES